jgi:hypothetical protein
MRIRRDVDRIVTCSAADVGSSGRPYSLNTATWGVLAAKAALHGTVVAWRVDRLRRSREDLQTIRLDEQVDNEGRCQSGVGSCTSGSNG